MYPGSFDPSHLQEIFSLAVLILFARPIIRRAGRHTNLWFIGWICIILHFFFETIRTPHTIDPGVLTLCIRWSVDVALLAFVLASEKRILDRIRFPLPFLLLIPMLFQSSLIAFPGHPLAVDRLAVLLFGAVGSYLLLSHRHRVSQVILLGFAYLGIGCSALIFDPANPSFVNRGELTVFMLIAAFLFLRSSPRIHRGVIAATAGMVFWALSRPMVDLLARFQPSLVVPRIVLAELPISIMSVGILLTLLEDYIHNTERLAMHDPLTELPNRRLFEERLTESLLLARAEKSTVACVVIDIDNFKGINDTLGHAAGDQVLRALAIRLASQMGPRDILARTGGDEFTALLIQIPTEQHLKEVASAMLSAVSLPILVDGQPLQVGISVGIARAPDHSLDGDSLRRAADKAMYSAKRSGGGVLAFASEEA